MEYTEALHKLSTLTRFGINLGLQRITALLRLFNDPQEQVPLIHIGGTNGKGSTQAMLCSILREAGYRVGAYTSPHLVSYRERFTINGENISQEKFAAIFTEIIAGVEQVYLDTGEYPTEFEVLTAMAFLYFAREKVDLALIEVGLGGDIDSTNVISRPLLSIITNVSLEHTAYLGTTLREIAAKKSGIIKRGCPVLTASREAEVLQVIRERARQLEAPLGEVKQQARWERLEEKEGTANLPQKGERPEGEYFSLQTRQNAYHELFLPLAGQHQLENAVTAIMAVEILQEFGFQIDVQEITCGLAQAKWPGRLEILRTKPLLVVDGAHNPAGMAALAQWLREKRQKRQKRGEVQRVILVMGMLDDKDRACAVGFLESLVDMAIITKPNSARAQEWDELGEKFAQQKIPVLYIEKLEQALKKALDVATTADLVLVTGSLYLIGEVKKIMQQSSSVNFCEET